MGYLPQMAADPGNPPSGGGAPFGGPMGGGPIGGTPGPFGGPQTGNSFLADVFRVIDSMREAMPSLKQGQKGLDQLQKGRNPLDVAGGDASDPLIQSQIGQMIQSYMAKNAKELGEDPYGYKRTQVLEKAALSLAKRDRTSRAPQAIRPDSEAGGMLNRFRSGGGYLENRPETRR